MNMIVLSVSRTYWNRGVRKHRRNAKKIWHVYYLDEDDNFKLHTKRINSWLVPYYKSQIRRKRHTVCLQCGSAFVGYYRNEKEMAIECPVCNDNEITLLPFELAKELVEILNDS